MNLISRGESNRTMNNVIGFSIVQMNKFQLFLLLDLTRMIVVHSFLSYEPNNLQVHEYNLMNLEDLLSLVRNIFFIDIAKCTKINYITMNQHNNYVSQIFSTNLSIDAFHFHTLIIKSSLFLKKFL